MLVAHFTEAFLQPGEEQLFRSHSHFEETRFIADTFLDLSYEVDVIDYRNRTFRPCRTYDLLVSARTNLEWYASQLNPGCTKIAHLGMAHWLVNNPAAVRRISSASTPDLRSMAVATWQIARKDHSRESYRKRYRQISEAILGQPQSDP